MSTKDKEECNCFNCQMARSLFGFGSNDAIISLIDHELKKASAEAIARRNEFDKQSAMQNVKSRIESAMNDAKSATLCGNSKVSDSEEKSTNSDLKLIHGWDVSEQSEPSKLEVIESTPGLKGQVGGDYYKTLAIQPIEYCYANKIPAIEAGVIKYVTRHKAKGGAKDIKKAIHLLTVLLELEYKC